MTQGTTLKAAIEEIFEQMRKEHPHLEGVRIIAVENHGMQEGWLTWKVVLSNKEMFIFQANPPRH